MSAIHHDPAYSPLEDVELDLLKDRLNDYEAEDERVRRDGHAPVDAVTRDAYRRLADERAARAALYPTSKNATRRTGRAA